MKSLLILGAGGFGQMVKETAIQLGYEEIVFLDDAAFGKDVVGKCCDYMAKYGEYKMAVAAFGIIIRDYSGQTNCWRQDMMCHRLCIRLQL